jgi:hypothetical protein
MQSVGFFCNTLGGTVQSQEKSIHDPGEADVQAVFRFCVGNLAAGLFEETQGESVQWHCL